MEPNQSRLQYLFQQFFNDTATPEEVREFWILYADAGEEDPANRDIWLMWNGSAVQNQPARDDWGPILDRIYQRAGDWEQKQPAITIRRPFRLVAAAAILFLIAIGSWLIFHPTKPGIAKTGTQQERFRNDVPPGSNGAILTLASGKKIVLDSAANGVIAIQGEGKIVNQNGQISYSNKENSATDMLYNSMSTGRGHQYKLLMADGSIAWLNAASSIRYPAAFNGQERKVTITGEVYFEVANDAKRPFLVTVNDMEIRVLGTHFNVNAYEDEAVATTTLLEGSVKISRNATSMLLAPGQQVRVKNNGSMSRIDNADLSAAIAWKNGYFTFDSTSIAGVMRQLSRWYDVDVSYEGNKIPSEVFWGDLPRNSSLSAILKALEKTGIKFTIDGKKIVVSDSH